jgi:hypothetical protein
MVNFFNETFRISYCERDKHVGLLRINFGTIYKNYIFTGATPKITLPLALGGQPFYCGNAISTNNQLSR